MSTRPPFRAQPESTPWPTDAWPRGEARVVDPIAFGKAAERAFQLTTEEGLTRALLVVQGGQLVHEQYAHGASPVYLEYSWSMAKSVTQALIGCLVADGVLDLDAPAPVPEWRADGDPRGAITLNHLLQMRSGLAFQEDYVDGQISDVIPMLFGDGRHDTGAYAAAKALEAAPGERFSYSSGTTNILCRILHEQIGGPTELLAFMHERLFSPTGMRTPTPRFDTSGTFIGSSFLLATPEDFARFGYLYLRGGEWNGEAVLPPGWADYARTPSYLSDIEGYGAQWWIHPQRQDWFFASGYDGQRIYVVPEKDAVVVRLGRTPVEHADGVWRNIESMIDTLEEAG